MEYTALELANFAISTVQRRFPAALLPPEGHFHYHQGVFLSGVEKIACITNEKAHFDYIRDWVDAMVTPEEDFICFNPGALDDLQPGILLFGLLERTGDEKYRRLLEKLAALLPEWKRNSEGGYWHMAGMPDQMWLDGLYMAGPLAVAYGVRYDRPDLVSAAFQQMKLMHRHCLQPATGLLVHGWDCSKKADWADSETGLAPEVWGRAAGWFAIGGLDMLEQLPEDHPERQWAQKVISDLVLALLRYQCQDTGLWYQVVDKGDQPGNWREASCSMLFTCAILRCIRLGLISESYMEAAVKGFCGVNSCVSLSDGGAFCLNNICVGTGIGSYAYYIARETSENDLHGMGAYLLLCAEMAGVSKNGRKFAVSNKV